MAGKPHISTVACDRWADWSLEQEIDGGEATVEIEREVVDGEKTSTLWVYVIETGGKRRPLREIAWVFEGAEPRDGPLCYVGVCVAKPKRDEDDGERGLEVTFKDFEVETWHDGVLKN